jgi:hypothetical protein
MSRQSTNRYTLALTELYIPIKHGVLEKQYHHLYNQYMIIDKVKTKEFYKQYDRVEEDVYILNKLYQAFTQQVEAKSIDTMRVNPYISNIIDILSKPNYVKIELVERVYLETGEAVAIIKTHWIRLIQRRWKKYLRDRNANLRSISHIRERELRGNVPQYTRFTLGLLA